MYYGTTSGTYINSIEVGNTTSVLISDLGLPRNRTYYVSVTAFADGGLESGHSNTLTIRVQ